MKYKQQLTEGENSVEKYTVCIDFDGVINPYTKSYQGKGAFEDPDPECKVALEELKAAGCKIIIHTTRSEIDLIREHLDHFKIPFDLINANDDNKRLDLSDKKPLGHVYLDDRAVNFGGNWKGLVHRILDFEPWHHKQYQNPFIPLEICGYKIDQISLFVPSIRESISAYSRIGYSNWVIDEVHAFSISGVSHQKNPFIVNLAFNYQIMPIEFELLEVAAGSTVQVPSSISTGLSHFGIHVDDMNKAKSKFEEEGGFKCMADIQTVHHSQCPYRFDYAFYDTRALGFITKLIKRREGK